MTVTQTAAVMGGDSGHLPRIGLFSLAVGPLADERRRVHASGGVRSTQPRKRPSSPTNQTAGIWHIY